MYRLLINDASLFVGRPDGMYTQKDIVKSAANVIVVEVPLKSTFELAAEVICTAYGRNISSKKIRKIMEYIPAHKRQ